MKPKQKYGAQIPPAATPPVGEEIYTFPENGRRAFVGQMSMEQLRRALRQQIQAERDRLLAQKVAEKLGDELRFAPLTGRRGGKSVIQDDFMDAWISNAALGKWATCPKK